jgi:proton-coupled amino acid transporter
MESSESRTEVKRRKSNEIIRVTIEEATQYPEDYKLDNGEEKNPTSYFEALVHLLKCNVGAGCFAMADAFKNGGIILGPILTIIISLICLHTQHILLNCSEKMRIIHKLKKKPDYAETVRLCFLDNLKVSKKVASGMKTMVNVLLCVTQLGFCCVYILFVSEHLKQLLSVVGSRIGLPYLMLICIGPVTLTSLITSLHFLTPCSFIAAICMFIGIGTTLGMSFTGLPSPAERRYVGQLETLPLFFGTVLFAFEGIALVRLFFID